MSLFGKQVEASPAPVARIAGQGAYGIEDLIRLLKTIPIDQHPELVVQVIKTTLESVGVKSEAVIGDAIARENQVRDALEMLESQIAVLKQEIASRQEQIAQLHMALREITDARSLLANSEALPPIDLNRSNVAESAELDAIDRALLADEPDENRPRTLPPPLPPPRWKAAHGPSQETP